MKNVDACLGSVCVFVCVCRVFHISKVSVAWSIVVMAWRVFNGVLWFCSAIVVDHFNWDEAHIDTHWIYFNGVQ